ncbi:hypothetical protein GmHk_02G004668 [Glycine max]|nr:hypothetical protein GmHk_02G004668 [Glycine max]
MSSIGVGRRSSKFDQGSRSSKVVSQPTPRWDGKNKIEKPKCSSPKEKMSGVATNVYLRKT